jgi:hypothetical protein
LGLHDGVGELLGRPIHPLLLLFVHQGRAPFLVFSTRTFIILQVVLLRHTTPRGGAQPARKTDPTAAEKPGRLAGPLA